MSEHLNLGGEIQSARTAAGYSLTDIEKITRIPSFILSDIEKNKFSTSGGSTYARGHIRTLAKLLNLNSADLIAKFEEISGELVRPMIELLEENNVTTPRVEKKRVSYKTLGVAAGVIVVLSIALPAMLSFTKVHKVVASKGSTPSSSSLNPVVATKSTGVTLIITGTEGQSWVGIQDATGTQIFSGRITKGVTQTFTDKQLLNVTVGNAAAVDLNVNGREMGVPGGVGEVVHLSLTPDQSSQG